MSPSISFRRFCSTVAGTVTPSRRLTCFDAETLFESHRNDPRIKHETYISTLIRSYGRAGMFDLSLRTYHQMDDFGTPRSVMSFNALLSACNRSRLFDKVPTLFDEILRKYRFSPDKFSYGILVKACCEMGSIEEALGILSEMEKKGIEVTIVTFTTIFNALHKNGMKDQARLLWDKIVSDGCQLDVSAYNTRIMYDHNGEAENVKALIDEMTSVGLKPNIISYNYLITCYCIAGMMEDAMEIYRGLNRNGCKPDASTFGVLIFHLCRKGDCEKGYEIMKNSVKEQTVPDFDTVKCLAEALVEKKKMEDAKELSRIVKRNAPPDEWKNVESLIGLASVVAADSTAPEEVQVGVTEEPECSV